MSSLASEVRLAERVEKLEAEVCAQGESLRVLHAAVRGATPDERSVNAAEQKMSQHPIGASGAGAARTAVERSFEEQSRRFRERLSGVLKVEWLFTRGGVLLLLLGVAFLFKLSVDEGWITPAIRVALGLALGVALIGVGLRIYTGRTTVGQVLLGGGIASLYISGFAAFTLYSLIPALVAFPFMLSVTVLAFVFSLKQDSATLSVIGISGGLATPFLLYTDEGSVAGLTLYTVLVFSGAVAVYLYRGWTGLISVATSGALLAFLVGGSSLAYGTDGISGDGIMLAGGIVFCWLASWISPIVRSYRSGAESSSRPHISLYLASSVMLPLVSFSLVRFVIEIDFPTAGFVWLGMAAGYGLLWHALRSTGRFADGRIVYVQAAVGTVLAVLATVELLSGWMLVLALAVEAVALHLLSTRNSDVLARISGHGLFAVLGLWLAFDILERTQIYPAQGNTALVWSVWLAVIGLALVSSFVLDEMGTTVYEVAAHGGLLGWLFAVLSPLDESGVWTTVAWGLYGVALVVGALRLDSRVMFRIGLATLLLVVGKLFIVDLFWVEALWRVALFIGFGGLFIALGYAVQLVWRPGATANRES